LKRICSGQAAIGEAIFGMGDIAKGFARPPHRTESGDLRHTGHPETPAL
jgi:hypothetical protein